MAVKVKICGITSSEQALLAQDAGGGRARLGHIPR